MTIPELIEKLKVADGPSRELDAEISPIVKGRARQISTFEQYEPSEVLPDFTGSIDAALTIGEEELKGGCWWLGHFDQRDRRYCCTMQRNSFPDAPCFRGFHATPAISICIARLTALAAVRSEK